MRVYVNGIDQGEGKVKVSPNGMCEVLYHGAMCPMFYPSDKCIITKRFGKKCMIFGGDYSEQDILKTNKAMEA